nr:uncharacterized protein LOC125980620 isoform X2 [Syngnathus scovelli]
MDAAMLRGQKMQNVTRRRRGDSRRCRHTRDDLMSVSHWLASKRSCRRTQRKQCIESEKLFHFLKDMTAKFSFPSASKGNRGLSVWPSYMPKRPEVCIQKSVKAEVTPRQSLDSLGNDSISSVNKLLSETAFMFLILFFLEGTTKPKGCLQTKRQTSNLVATLN